MWFFFLPPGGGAECDVIAQSVGTAHAQYGHPQQTQGGDEETPTAEGENNELPQIISIPLRHGFYDCVIN